MFKNEYELNVDIKKKMTAITPTFVQYDNAVLLFRIFDNGKKFDLSGFTKAEVSHRLKSGKVVIGEAKIEGLGTDKWIRYTYLGSEMDEIGFVDTSLSIYSDSKRVSIQPFKVRIIVDLIGEYAKPSEPRVDALQTLIATVEDLRVRAEVAIDNAQAFADDLGYENAFNMSFSYKKNNIVSYNGSSYMAIKDSTGKVPIGDPADTYWRLIARKGEDGEGLVTLHKDTFISTEGQRVFTLSNTYDQMQNRIHLNVGGSLQYSPENFMETSSNSITLNEPLHAGVVVTAIYFGNAPAIKNDLQTQITNMSGTIQQLSDNVDIQIGGKVDKQVGKQLSTEDFTTEDKAKLNSIESEANKYIPPVSKFISFTSSDNQTAFTITGGYIDIRVFVGGVEQFSPNNFTKTSPTIFTVSEPLKGEIVVEAVYTQ